MISVVLSTYNGERTLPLTLEALEGVQVPEGGVEFIVVDNASTDATPRILDRFAPRLNLIVLHEPRRGKSHAINTGLDRAQGDLIVLTDDDVLPVPGWLTAYAEAAAAHPEAGVFAGQVRHHWQKTPPDWLVRLAEEGRSFAGTPIGLEDGPMGFAHVKGLNLMTRREVKSQVRFSDATGVNFGADKGAPGGEDTDFVKRAVAAGYELRFVSAACVKHIVRPEQVGLRPVVDRYIRIGRANSLLTPPPREMATLFGYPRYVFRVIPRDLAKATANWLRGDRYHGANKLIDVAMVWGRAIERKRDARTRGEAS